MGETKHICYCNDRHCKSLTGKHNKEILLKEQAQLRENIKGYLAEPPCVGVSAEELPQNTKALALGQLYTTAVQHLRRSQQDRISLESLQLSALLGDIFVGLWSLPTALSISEDNYRLKHKAFTAEDSAASVNELLQKLNTSASSEKKEDAEGDSMVETADLLVQGYTRALGELEHAVKDNNPSIVMHHMALVGDTLAEMLRLVIYLNPDRCTEERLPESHPHSRIMSRFVEENQERASQESEQTS